MPSKDLKRRHVLLVEDNEADAVLARMVHDQVKHCSGLHVVNSAADALAYFRDEAKLTDGSGPDVVLMDMNLHGLSGLELIREIRASPGRQFLPIVMISGSENPADLRRGYELGANCVLKKSSGWEEYFHKLKICYEFWCRVAELPK